MMNKLIPLTIEEWIARLQEHHTRQIDENRKVSKRMDDLEALILSQGNFLLSQLNSLEDSLLPIRAKVAGLCKTEEMRWRDSHAKFTRG